MAHYRGGKRGHANRSQFSRDVERISARMTDTGSATGRIPTEAVHYLGSEVEETDEVNEFGLLIPGRKALGVQQHLGSFSPTLEFSNLNDYTVSLLTGKREENKTVGNPRKLEWKSDTTLLRRNNPFSFSEESLKRQTSKSKRIKYFGKSEKEVNEVLSKLELANTPGRRSETLS
jgi:hypothetical protein